MGTENFLQRGTMRYPRFTLAGIRCAVAFVLLWLAPALSWATTRGPDAGGYTATDGVVYSFVDISGSSGGASVLSGTDDGTAALTLPFTFQFYGHPYTVVCASSNGAIYFVPAAAQCGGLNDFNNIDLGTSASPGDFPALFPWWSDLSFQVSGAGSVFYQTMGAPGSRRFIVQWDRAYASGSANPLTFQAILFEGSNRILFQYKTADLGAGDAASKGGTATIGVRDGGALASLKQIEWSFNSSVIANESAVMFDGRTLAPTAATLFALPSTVGVLQPVLLVGIVNSPSGVPTGSLQFKDGGTVIGTSALTNGVGVLIANGLTSGVHSITAVYAGGGDFAASTSAPASVTIRNANVSTFTFVIQWTNPAAQGQPVVLSALVQPLAPGTTPTGTVQFKEGNAVLGTAAIANGLASISINTLTVGQHSIAATYPGNATFAASTSSPVVQTVYSGARPRSSTVALATSPSPSTFGQPVTVTATITPSSGVPTGTVYFFADDLPLGSATVTQVGGVFKATLTVSALSRGAHVLGAAYLGDTVFSSSNSLPAVQVVQ
jgi:hypothetical protein